MNTKETRICLTVDIEWAPEFVIEWMVKRVKEAGISATWFATHDSPVLRKITVDPTQEVGLHPNFFPGSTQGRTMEEIVDGLFSVYPDARGVRAHALLDSTRHQRYYAQRGIKYVSNIIVWNKPSEPFFQPWTGLWQIPISWEDDVACMYVKNMSFNPRTVMGNDLWVINFHPLYCYLNDTVGMPAYTDLKAHSIDVKDTPRQRIETLRQGGAGLANALAVLMKKRDDYKFVTMRSVYDEMKRGCREDA